MRDAAELIALITEHGIDLAHIPGGRGALTWADVMAAIGMIHDQPAANLLLAKYAMDGSAAYNFLGWWHLELSGRAYKCGYVDPTRTLRLAAYTLSEHLSAQRCRTCKGVGHQVAEHGKVSACPACEGSGMRHIGDRPAAKGLGMSASGYRKSKWPGMVDWCRDELRRVEGEALGKVARRLSN